MNRLTRVESGWRRLRRFWRPSVRDEVDVVVSLRALEREPLFAAGVVLTLALGIGANVTMFGIVDRLMLRGPAHVVDARAVKRVYITANMGPQGVETMSYLGYMTYATLRDRAKSFSGVGAYQAGNQVAYGIGAAAKPLDAAYATWDLFSTLGVHPLIGRFYARDEDSPPDGAKVVVVSQEFSRSRWAWPSSPPC